MLTSLHIKNFRGFKSLDLASLKRVNLIVGQSNTGKTGLLEALALLLWNPPANCGNLPNIFRSTGGDYNENFWKWLFYNKDTTNALEITAQFRDLSQFGIYLGKPHPAGEYRHTGGLAGIPLFTLGGRESAGL